MNARLAGPSAVSPSGREEDEHIPLYGPEFAANPAEVYARLREHGPVAPIELAPGVAAMLVVGYDAALSVLHDSEAFPKDPRRWQGNVPADCPVLPMMAHRPNCLFAEGDEHVRLRTVVADSMGRVNLHELRAQVELAADRLISEVGPIGNAELISQYALPLPLAVLNYLFGCPPVFEARMLGTFRSIVDGGSTGDAEKANAELSECMMELLAYKRAQPGQDVISWMLSHPAQLTDEEMLHQLALIMLSAVDTEKNLISNALRLLLADHALADDLSGGSLLPEDAIDRALWTETPVANFGTTYPRQDCDIAGVRLPADQPVVVSFAAANTDPSVFGEHQRGNRAHLAWSAGPHSCPGPAQQIARLIALVAIEKLLDGVPGIQLAVPADQLKWQVGPFIRALESLPVQFPPTRATNTRRPEDTASRKPSASSEPSATAVPATPPRRTPEQWWRCLVRWWEGP